jgi:hypothetical protein
MPCTSATEEFENAARQRRPEHHRLARGLVIGRADRPAQVGADEARRLEREHVGQHRRALGDVGLDRVRERVHADPRRQVRRRRDGQLVVRDRDARHQVAVEHHHLDVAVGVGDDRHARDLAAGPCRGRHGDQRQAGAGHVAVAGVVAHIALVGKGHGRRLGGVHRAAPADRDDTVGLVVAHRLQRALDIGERRVGLDVAERRHLGIACLQALDERTGRPLIEEEAIGDHERARDPEARDVRGEVVRRATADHQVLGQMQLDRAVSGHCLSSPAVSGTLPSLSPGSLPDHARR